MSSGGNVALKRGTEDLDYFIGDEAVAAAGGPGTLKLRSEGYEVRKGDASQTYG